MHLFTGMWERSITTMPCVFVRDLTSEVIKTVGITGYPDTELESFFSLPEN